MTIDIQELPLRRDAMIMDRESVGYSSKTTTAILRDSEYAEMYYSLLGFTYMNRHLLGSVIRYDWDAALRHARISIASDMIRVLYTIV